MADPWPTFKRHLDHGSFGLELVADVGDYQVWCCDVCHLLVAECMHPSATWGEEGTTLTCDFCGLDGT